MKPNSPRVAETVTVRSKLPASAFTELSTWNDAVVPPAASAWRIFTGTVPVPPLAGNVQDATVMGRPTLTTSTAAALQNVELRVVSCADALVDVAASSLASGKGTFCASVIVPLPGPASTLAFASFAGDSASGDRALVSAVHVEPQSARESPLP